MEAPNELYQEATPQSTTPPEQTSASKQARVDEILSALHQVRGDIHKWMYLLQALYVESDELLTDDKIRQAYEGKYQSLVKKYNDLSEKESNISIEAKRHPSQSKQFMIGISQEIEAMNTELFQWERELRRVVSSVQ